MYLFFCICSIHIFYYAVNKTFYRRTDVRPQNLSQIRCSAKCWDEWQCGFSFYGVENESLLRVICHTERLKPFQTTGGQKYFRSDWVSFLLLFMGKTRVKTRLTSLHCSQRYRHLVEQNVDSLWYYACLSWVYCSLTTIVL